MKNPSQDQAIGFPINSASSNQLSIRSQYHLSSAPSNGSSAMRQNSMLKRMNKLGKNADNFAQGVREHMRLGPKISETVKGKLRLGAKILRFGGVEKIFKKLFRVTAEDDKLLKACQCYLSTTAGPIAGLLFLSTHKVAFCSERSIKLSSPDGQSVRLHYKVVIPLAKVKRVNKSENLKKPSQKYMEIVTVDNFDFWFMGFLNYQKTFKYLQVYLQQAIFQNIDDVKVTGNTSTVQGSFLSAKYREELNIVSM